MKTNFRTYKLREVSKESVCDLISVGYPFKLILEDYLIADKHVSNSGILSDLFNDSELLQVSASTSGKYSGETREHSQLNIPIQEYLSYRNLGSLKLYLSQVELNCQQISKLCKVSDFIRDFGLGSLKVNLWHSFSDTESKTHFDGYNNLLYVESGVKHLLISQQDMTHKVRSSEPNHLAGEFYIPWSYSKFNVTKIKWRLNQMTLGRADASNIVYRVSVHPQEMLFIPKGWWHHVHTVGSDNLAMNFWWNHNIERSEMSSKNTHDLIVKLRESACELLKKQLISFHRKNMKRLYRYSIQAVQNSYAYPETALSLSSLRKSSELAFFQQELNFAEAAGDPKIVDFVQVLWKDLKKINKDQSLLKRMEKALELISKKLLLSLYT